MRKERRNKEGLYDRGKKEGWRKRQRMEERREDGGRKEMRSGIGQVPVPTYMINLSTLEIN
jgi:hypothetical protein